MPANGQSPLMYAFYIAEETRPRNHKLTAHEVLWEEGAAEEAPPALKRSQGKARNSSQPRPASGIKPKKSSKPRKMQRLGGNSSDEDENAHADGDEVEG